MSRTATDASPAGRAVFSGTGVLIAIAFLALVGVGAIVSLATGSWWALAAATVVHGIATIAFLVVFVPLLDRSGDKSPAGDHGDDRATAQPG